MRKPPSLRWPLLLLAWLAACPPCPAQGPRVRAGEAARCDELGQPLSYPSALFCDRASGEIYVVNSGRSRVVVYTSDYFPFLSIGPGRGVVSPCGVLLDRSGNLYVCQGESKGRPARISVFNAAFLPVRDILLRGFEGCERFVPHRLALGRGGRIYVAGTGLEGGAVVLDAQGRFLHLLVPRDRLPPEPVKPATIVDVAVDEEGRIYLLSEEMGRVYVYDARERFLFKFGQKGGSTGKLSRPQGIAVDSRRGRIYVVDYMRHTVNVYSRGGIYLYELGGRGWGPGWFNYPTDVAVDERGYLLVADLFNQRVQVLEVREEGAPPGIGLQ